LSDAVLETIEVYRGTDLGDRTFPVSESIDLDALDRLFRHDASSPTLVEFFVDDVRVRCCGDGEVDIRVDGHANGSA
jgi:hypothetical protein